MHSTSTSPRSSRTRSSRLAAEDLGELAGVFPASRSLGRGRVPTTATERFRAHQAVRELIERLAEPPVCSFSTTSNGPTGRRWSSVALLRRPPRAGVMIAASYRTGQADQALVAALEAPALEGGVVTVELGPLKKARPRALIGASPTECERFTRRAGATLLHA